MTDIVERLRARNVPYGSLVVMDEAADEIERLGAELREEKNYAARLHRKRVEFYEENLRLRAALAEIASWLVPDGRAAQDIALRALERKP